MYTGTNRPPAWGSGGHSTGTTDCAWCPITFHARAVDGVTGLPERSSWERRAGHALTHTGTEPSVLLLLDLDRFRAVNDAHGRAAGDVVLAALAGRLREAVGATGIVGRCTAGTCDEFLVLLPATSLEAGLATARTIRARLGTTEVTVRSASGHPVVVEGVTASIGVGVCLDGDLHEPLRQADVALLRAKHAGRDRIALPSWV
ncbi:GGDEF domain-containing protein [Amycolatopsis suaedae]|uniref:GGDEF domain-containing protein n=1 Tax=Amycolatopsis suaedae TaxID=2510978 RepID=UPI0013EF46EF|nr:GGDEF domain-containing protein [Amycolatopsis suaedae]